MRASEVQGTRFSVIGGARSGLAVAALLHAHGGKVFLSEKAPAEKLGELRRELERRTIPYEFGGHSSRVLDADVVVLSPGVPSDAPVIRDALSHGMAVVSELEVASWFCRAPIVAISGTNGKTTTTALTGRMFSDARVPTVVAGNIGAAFSGMVEELTGDHVAVLEVSSFQLDHIGTFRPRVAALLNITPDHLDRYGHSLEKYRDSKCRIFENQGGGDTLIYNADDRSVRDAVERRAPRGVALLPFSQEQSLGKGAYVRDGRLLVSTAGKPAELCAVDAISIPGTHNLYNAMAAALAAEVMGVPAASIRATLKNFRGVEHRLEFVREVNGVRYVNDSKGTNVDSVWYALRSYSAPIVLLLGGRDKGNDYARLFEQVRQHVRAIVAIGESAEKVRGAFAALVPVTLAMSMSEAVAEASRLAHRGDVVLLSPACASFDWFDNYEHRGRVFKELVLRLEAAGRENV